LNATPKAASTVDAPVTGVVATFSDDSGSATAGEFAATINWGDDQSTNGIVQADGQGGFSVTGTNTFGAARLVPLSVHVEDFGGANDLDVSNVIQVNPANTNALLSVAPTPGISGQPVALTAHFTTKNGVAVMDGFVLFEDGSQPLGVEPLNSVGIATLHPNTSRWEVTASPLSSSALLPSAAVRQTRLRGVFRRMSPAGLRSRSVRSRRAVTNSLNRSR
jgi:hypothetical protein